MEVRTPSWPAPTSTDELGDATTKGRISSDSAKSASVKVCGCRPHEGGAARTGAGVRKPPMEETAGGVARGGVRRYGIWRLSCLSASTTFAIWHELCEWVKTPFAVPVISKSYAL